jgi:branched-chain amino acid transport system substrate-binding protein
MICTAGMVSAGCVAGNPTTGPAEPPTPATGAAERKPFFDARSQVAEYVGPGRETPPPEDITEVKLGWFGPDDPDHPTAGQMWLAASMAVEEANDRGGYHGLPFRLVTSWSENPWGTGVKGVTQLVYEEQVWAIVGAPDGPSAHLVAQVVAKARLPFISAVSTDKTANLANVPWIFSCAPGDHLLAPVLAKAAVARIGKGTLAVVSCTDHDSRLFATELLSQFAKLDTFPGLGQEFRPGSAGFDTQLQSIQQAEPAAVVLIAGPLDAARFLIALRREAPSLPVFGGPSMGRRAFLQAAGQSAEGVIFSLLWDPSAAGRRSEEFAREFRRRFGLEPDYTAAHTYDAVHLLIAATRRAGLNRARIRDAVRELSPWSGASGTITWDPTGQNHRSVGLGTIRNAETVPLEPPYSAGYHPKWRTGAGPRFSGQRAVVEHVKRGTRVSPAS